KPETQVLEHLVLQSLWLQHERIPKRAETAAQQIKFRFPIELVPICQQQLSASQLSLPFLLPIGAQPARDDYTDDPNQPEPETKARCARHISHGFHMGFSRVAMPPLDQPLSPPTQAGN